MNNIQVELYRTLIALCTIHQVNWLLYIVEFNDDVLAVMHTTLLQS